MALSNPRQNNVGLFRSNGPATSKKAALAIYPNSGTRRHQVLTCFVRAGSRGCTRDEVQQQIQIPDSSCDARVIELRDGGWIEDTAIVRPTRYGIEAIVLELTTDAIDYFLANLDEYKAIVA